MLLAIDVGNTNISLGVFRQDKLLRRYIIPTAGMSYSAGLKKIFKAGRITQAIICSVVPQATGVLRKELRSFLPKPALIVGHDIRVPIRNLYRKPRQVGADRLVNAHAGVIIYGCPLIVVDFGTAITFDVISSRKEYLGGMILPGFKISLEALAQRTALLPKVKLERPEGLIGGDTKASMLSGIVYGFACLTDGLTQRIKGKLGSRAKVIATGGDAELAGKYCKRIDKIDPDLTLKGLNLIFNA